MVVHVGIEPRLGNFSYYSEIDKSTIDEKTLIVWEHETDRINTMYEQIISKVKGKLGFVCIYLSSNFGGFMRKKFIEEGLKHGFKNVEIINLQTTVYLHALFQVSYRPRNDDIVWINVEGVFDVWKIIDGKAKYIGCWGVNVSNLKDLESTVNATKLNKGPDIVICVNDLDKENFRKISPSCIFASFCPINYVSKGSLVKARIVAGDESVVQFDAVNFLSKVLNIKYGNKNITFPVNHKLPIVYSRKLIKDLNSESLHIESFGTVEFFKFPNFEEVNFIFKVNASQIYSVTLNNDMDENDDNVKTNQLPEVSTMMVHVGLSPQYGELFSYNEMDRCTEDTTIMKVCDNEIDKIYLMYDEIIRKINGKICFLCIYLSCNYGNEIRKKFVEEGFNNGFKNVEIINLHTAMYVNGLWQNEYQPINGDVIWIGRSYGFDAWKITNQKAEFIAQSDDDLSSIKSQDNFVKKTKLNRGPNVVIYDRHIIRLGISHVTAHFCKRFLYTSGGHVNSKESLLQARIASGDCSVAHLESMKFLSRNVDLNIGNLIIISYEPGQKLPVVFSRRLKKTENMLIIKIDGAVKESYKITNDEHADLTFELDINEIYAITINGKPVGDNDRSKTRKRIKTNASKQLESSTKQNQAVAKYYKIPTITSMKINVNAVGIDLGTSRCCAAVNRKNGINTVPLDNNGERLLPSYIAYDERNLKFGQIVIDRLRNFSKSTIFDSKRILGRNINEIEIDSLWPFEISVVENKITLQVQMFNEMGAVTAEDASAALLKHIKQKTEDFQGKLLNNVVITVPAAFTETQRTATTEAARLAGWDEVVLLPEPVAAAFAYFNDRPISNNSNVLLFDLGGGTLDVCIFKIENSKIKVISNTGDAKLGGRNFDTILINYFKNALSTKYGISLERNKKYLLMTKCQKMKENLSFMKSCSLDIDDFDSNQDGLISLSREEFQKMSHALLNKVKNTVQSALYHSKYVGNQIDKILLVGGGSRMPMIKELLLEIFPQAEHCCEEHPDEVVAIGAAYYAYHIFYDK